MNSAPNESQETTPVPLSEVDAEFLPLIYDIIKCVERDPGDAAAKNKESLDASAKIQELNKKLTKAKAAVKKLPGIDFNPEEQKAYLASLKKQLTMKKELVKKYKDLGDAVTFFNRDKEDSQHQEETHHEDVKEPQQSQEPVVNGGAE